jgi:hypothetical protein
MAGQRDGKRAAAGQGLDLVDDLLEGDHVAEVSVNRV